MASRSKPWAAASASFSVRDRRGPLWVLDRSLAAIAAEVPEAYDAIGQALGPRTISVAVDGDVTYVSMVRGYLELRRWRPSSCAVELRMTTSTIRRLLGGQSSLLEAVRAGDVSLRGPMQDVASLHD